VQQHPLDDGEEYGDIYRQIVKESGMGARIRDGRLGGIVSKNRFHSVFMIFYPRV
jgi:hypothetical protein